MLTRPRDGDEGTMIDAFVQALREPDSADPDRLDWAFVWIASALGGPVSLMWPFEGVKQDYAPGSQLAEAQREGRLLSRSDWLDLLHEQLHGIIAGGLSEAFLVRGLVHFLGDFLEVRADPDDSQAKAEILRGILSELETDPDARESFRRSLGEAGGDLSHLTDREFVAKAWRVMGQSAVPPDVDETAKRWAQLEAWKRDTANLMVPWRSISDYGR